MDATALVGSQWVKQDQIYHMDDIIGIMQSVEPVLENAIKTLQKVVDIRGMGKK